MKNKIRAYLTVYIFLLPASQFDRYLVESGQDGSIQASGAVQYADIDHRGENIKIAYRKAGAGTPLLLIHGSPGNSQDFERLIPKFKNFLVIAPDLPGYGDSSRWISDYSIENNAWILLEFMDKMNLKRYHIAGYSYGSGIALTMAHLRKDEVISLSLYGGIGIQETEGSGNYALEHVKYALGYLLFVILPEAVPDFGLLGPRSLRHAFIRNFLDTDQRKISGFMEGILTDTLILHAVDDILVHAFAAREHHRLLKNSSLVMLDKGNHFLPFSDAGSEILHAHISNFLAKVENQTFRRSTFDLPDMKTAVPLEFSVIRKNPLATVTAIAAATFISEDLTCISSGLLIRDRKIDFFTAILGCFLGIFAGDMGLWILGRVIFLLSGRIQMLSGILSLKKTRQLQNWMNENTASAVFASRFIPGTRFVTYTAAGMAGGNAGAFMFWAFLAAFLWTPLLVLLSAFFGSVFTDPLTAWLESGWILFFSVTVLIFIALRIVIFVFSGAGRFQMRMYILRLFNREFWPSWILYTPLSIYYAFLSFRFRSATLPAISNPGIYYSGIAGESKSEILASMMQKYISPYIMVDAESCPKQDVKKRKLLYGNAVRRLKSKKISFPVIAKPDVAERGAGLRLLHSSADLKEYFENAEENFILQRYHPGPCEAGILYYRFPGERAGRIFSATDKVFPKIAGDGKHTVDELIKKHQRFRFQYKIFRSRLSQKLGVIPAAGEIISLGIAGNHCQGTMFKDGSSLVTDALEKKIDAIARTFRGFYVGRFDIRYKSRERFARGMDFEIIELNGALGESTNIYDPSFGYFRALAVYAKHMRILFEIGNLNRKKGVKPPHIREIVKLVVRHMRRKNRSVTAD